MNQSSIDVKSRQWIFIYLFIIIEMFVFDIIIKYIRSIFEFSKNDDVDFRNLRKQKNKFLNQKLNSIIAFNAWKEKQQLHKKIDIYENFMQMKYFDQLKEYSDNTVISIRHDIRQILQNYLLLAADFEIESAALSFSCSSLFSCFVSVLKSFSLKNIKIMFKSKRETLIVTTIQNKELSCRTMVLRHEINKMILRRRLKKNAL
jgi:cell division protein ZapA (FtsZ GTPase activity inhibitor)